MAIDRRTILAFGSGALLPLAQSKTAAAEIPHEDRIGFGISIRWMGEWEVAVLDESYKGWYPGMAVPIKWMLLKDFTAQLEREMREAV